MNDKYCRHSRETIGIKEIIPKILHQVDHFSIHPFRKCCGTILVSLSQPQDNEMEKFSAFQENNDTTDSENCGETSNCT